MFQLRKTLILSFLLVSLFSCRKELVVNASWQDITIVYGILNQSEIIHYLDWTTFSEVKSLTDKGNQTMIYSIPGEEFYRFLSLNLLPDPDITRSVGLCKFTFLVGSDDLDTYLSVSLSSNSIIQSKPAFSNIDNGIGLLASRHTVSFDSLWFADITKDSLKTNRFTKDLGF